CCFFTSHDLGLAVGSAVSIAADMGVDSRVMYSAGVGAIKAGLIAEDLLCIAIPISVSGKSVYFDREE
ncbi:MAG: ferredoxin domain-containing protein, partial [Clostridia bacterium]|nr:ferredoxin domain-containing protein [Clostridia bacterium]